VIMMSDRPAVPLLARPHVTGGRGQWDDRLARFSRCWPASRVLALRCAYNPARYDPMVLAHGRELLTSSPEWHTA
jgi:hypothetical protein